MTGSHTAIQTKQAEHGEGTGVSDAAVTSNSQSRATKQKKKKKKKLKGLETAVEKTSSVVERREEVFTHLAPEFHNLDEFPSLFSLKNESGSKKTPLHPSALSTPGIAHFTSSIYNFCLMHNADIEPSLIVLRLSVCKTVWNMYVGCCTCCR